MKKLTEFTGFSSTYILHSLIGVSIMLFGRFLPCISTTVPASDKLLAMGFPEIGNSVLISINPTGMLVLTLFLGVIYLWTTVDTLWPSLLAIFLLGISPYAPMPHVLTAALGNPQIVLVFMLFIFCAALIKSQVSVYLARALMTQKVLEGRPWLLTATILFTCYAAGFLESASALFIIWPAVYVIFNEVGYKKGDRYVSLLMVNSLIMVLLAFATDSIKGGAFLVLSSLYGIAQANPELNIQPINTIHYFIFGIILSLTIMFLLLFMMRFIYRVDVKPLMKLNVDVLKTSELPPMNWRQKTLIFLFGLYVFLMALPGILPKDTFLGQFFGQNFLGTSLFIVVLLALIQYKGEKLLSLPQIMPAYPWNVFFLTIVAFLLGGAVTTPSTGISIFLESVLRESFTGLSFIQLSIAAVVIGIIITNFSNSIVVAIIIAPILAALCNAYGFETSPLLACFFFTVLVAVATPAASPYTAILFENTQWVSVSNIVLYAILGSIVVVFVVLTLGIPLAQIFF